MTMEVLADWVSRISNVVWNGLLLYLLVGTGIVFTIRTRFIQVRKFGAGWKHLFGHFSLNGEKAGKDGMSPFQALTTAIAAQVGTGNIAGAATALYSGGPGAIFWMWLSAFFGMSTIYGEAVLAQKYKTTDDKGHVTGGPIYYIRARFQGGFGKFLAGFFSVAIIFALGFTGNMVQANSISVAFKTAFGAPQIVVGIVCAIIAAFIFLGGAWSSCASTMRQSSRRSSPSLLRRLIRSRSSAAQPASRYARRCATALHAACSPTRPAWAPRRTHTRWPR